MNKKGELPVGGVDYPRTLQEFDDWFATEEKCLGFIKQLRWSDGFVCPECNNDTGWDLSNGLIRCGNCRNDISVLHGTTFHKTRKPLRTWFQAMWYAVSYTHLTLPTILRV